MARPDPIDIARCLRCATTGYDVEGDYVAALRVLNALSGDIGNYISAHHNPALAYHGIDINDWLYNDVAGNCAQALELYAQYYPEG